MNVGLIILALALLGRYSAKGKSFNRNTPLDDMMNMNTR